MTHARGGNDAFPDVSGNGDHIGGLSEHEYEVLGLRTAIEQLRDYGQKILDEKDALLKDEKELREQIEALFEQRLEQLSSIEELEAEVTRLTEALGTSSAELEHTQDANKQIQAKLDEERARFIELQTVMTRLESERDEDLIESGQKDRELSSLKERIKELMAELEQAKAHTGIKAQLQEALEVNAELREQNQQLASQSRALLTELERLRKENGEITSLDDDLNTRTIDSTTVADEAEEKGEPDTLPIDPVDAILEELTAATAGITARRTYKRPSRTTLKDRVLREISYHMSREEKFDDIRAIALSIASTVKADLVEVLKVLHEATEPDEGLVIIVNYKKYGNKKRIGLTKEGGDYLKTKKIK